MIIFSIMNKYLILFLFILFIWGFFIEPNLLVVKKYCGNYWSKDSKIKKIVFVSDFHISKNDLGRLRRIVKLVNKQNPDLVLSGGDYIKGHNGKTTMDIEIISKELSKINAPVISVLGNHELWDTDFSDSFDGRKKIPRTVDEIVSDYSVMMKNNRTALCSRDDDLRPGGLRLRFLRDQPRQ